MSFPGQVEKPEPRRIIKYRVYLPIICVICCLGIIWYRVKTTLKAPLPVQITETQPGFAKHSSSHKNIIDIVTRDTKRLLKGDILAHPEDTPVNIPNQNTVRDASKIVPIRHPSQPDYYETTGGQKQ